MSWPVFDWGSERVVLTGGAGFVGRVVHRKLVERGCRGIVAPRREECDLRDPGNVRDLLVRAAPTMVIHLAAVVGGIGANRANPGTFFHDNAVMGIHLIEEARKAKVRKFVQVGTICAYPRLTPVPFRESDLWNGYPEETNAPYGLAKKMLLVQLQAYRAQWGFNGIYLLPVNLYGPGDNFDPGSSHVIPAMIRKMVDARRAGAPSVTLWGTGSASREFLYVDDAGEAIVLAAERYNEPDPVNLGSGEEITIRDLAGLIGSLAGYEGRIVWDATKPDGQPRRNLDVRRARERFGFAATTAFRDGLARTLAWYCGSGPGAQAADNAPPPASPAGH